MSWASAVKNKKPTPQVFAPAYRPPIERAVVDWDRLVALDFETFFDSDYTLSKMSTSEYVRDKRFKAQMVGIKVGKGKTKIVPHKRIAAELKKINWATHGLLCHNIQFDGFILSHHYGIVPAKYYCTLSMARGLHSNEIGAGLDEVAKFYGGQGKIDGVLETTKGVLDWPKAMYDNVAIYCAQDVDEMYRIFREMHAVYPADEINLIHMTARMFCDPVLTVDLPRVQKEYEREVKKREQTMFAAVDPTRYDIDGDLYDKELHKKLLKGPAERALTGLERNMLIVKRIVGSNERFIELLLEAGISEDDIPRKISKAWMAKPVSERDDADKWSYAFAKDDLDFINLPDRVWDLFPELDPNDQADVIAAAEKSERLQLLVDVRIAVKSTTNITRAARFLEAGRDGMRLPVGYAYYRAHTGRWAGNNKMNCLPGESEVLTPQGWVPLARFGEQGVAAVWDSQTRGVHFAAVGRVKLHHKGAMVRAKTRTGAHNALYTPDHGLPVAAYRNPERVVRKTAAEMVDHSDWILPVSGQLSVAEGEISLSPEMARVAACMQADGSIVPNSAHSDAAQFAFTKQRKVERFREIFAAAGVRFTETTAGEYTKFYVSHGQAPMSMFKHFGAWLLKLSGQALAALVDEAAHWDGHIRGDSYIFASAARANAEWLQTAAHLCGRSAQLHEVDNYRGWNKNPQARLWIVNVKPRPYVTNEKARSPMQLVEGYDDEVYCLTTPTGWFLMRHNGTIQVTGNCQNLTRGGELRLSILAAKGHQIAVADSGQIEARVNGWLWDQDDLLAAFRNADTWDKSLGVARGDKRDAYCRFADDIYGREITTNDKLERFVGKVCVLGLGYQMGAAKLQMTLAKGALGGPPVYFSLDECKHIINTYRRRNYKIANGWKVCERIIEDMAAGRNGEHKCISWGMDDNGNGFVLLPNGMCLKYPDLRKAQGDKGWDEWTYQSGDMRKKIYGGLLCENLVQALARIIVATQMLWIDTKYRVVMTTHDEVVTHPKKAQASKCYDWMYRCMTTPLAWCPDIPLAAEGGFDDRYSK